MKQLIVLIATILLGVAIGGFILSFSGQARQIQQTAASSIETFLNESGAGS